MEKEATIWSGFFTFLGLALLFGFRQAFTGNFAFDKFYEYKFVVSLSFYVGLLFFVFGLILFLFFYVRDRKKR